MYSQFVFLFLQVPLWMQKQSPSEEVPIVWVSFLVFVMVQIFCASVDPCQINDRNVVYRYFLYLLHIASIKK